MKTLLDPTSIKTGQAIRWESSTEERSLVYQYVAQHDGQGCGIPTEGHHFLMG